MQTLSNVIYYENLRFGFNLIWLADLLKMLLCEEVS